MGSYRSGQIPSGEDSFEGSRTDKEWGDAALSPRNQEGDGESGGGPGDSRRAKCLPGEKCPSAPPSRKLDAPVYPQRGRYAGSSPNPYWLRPLVAIRWFLPFPHILRSNFGGWTLKLHSDPSVVDIENRAWAAPLRGTLPTVSFVRNRRSPRHDFCAKTGSDANQLKA